MRPIRQHSPQRQFDLRLGRVVDQDGMIEPPLPQDRRVQSLASVGGREDKDCTIENIMMVLHARFGRLPTALNDRLQTLSQGDLDRIIVQGATAATLEEAVKVPLISRVGEDGAVRRDE